MSGIARPGPVAIASATACGTAHAISLRSRLWPRADIADQESRCQNVAAKWSITWMRSATFADEWDALAVEVNTRPAWFLHRFLVCTG